MNKVKTEDLKGFFGRNRKFKRFSGRKQVISGKKKSSSQKCHEIRCQSSQFTKIPVANTNLGLDLHSNSPEPVNFFGVQSSLGGTIFVWGGTSSHLGGHGPGMPPVAPGLNGVSVWGSGGRAPSA